MLPSSPRALVLALAVAATSLAAPTPQSAQEAAFPSTPNAGVDLPITSNVQRRSGSDLLSHATAERNRLRLKYGITSGKERRATTSASLTNYQADSTWYADIQMGTPAQGPFHLILDTGSSDIWVSSSVYSPSSSSSFQNLSTAFSLTYGSGSVSGYLGNETITLASQTVSSQTFAVGTQATQGLVDETLNGIFGLGFKALSSSGATPYWQNVGAGGFSFYLNKAQTVTLPSQASSSSSSSSGVFTLGGANSSLYQGSINWLPLTSESYWTVSLDGVTSSGSTIGLNNLKRAILDTGTSLIGGPSTLVQELWSQVSGASASTDASGYYEFPCPDSSSTINVTLTLGDQAYTLDSSDLNAGAVDQSGQTCLGSIFSLGDVGSNTPVQWLIGDTLLVKVYSVWDGNNARVGLAQLADGLGDGSASTTVTRVTTSGAGGRMAMNGLAVIVAVLVSLVVAL